jgi:RNA-binding protein
VIAEMEAALKAHEVVKVKARFEEREERDEALDALAKATQSHLVQRVGHMGLFYRPKESLKRLVLPD